MGGPLLDALRPAPVAPARELVSGMGTTFEGMDEQGESNPEKYAHLWSMTTWFTSDQHFGHARIIELCDRPFVDVDAMNEAIVARHNAAVQPGDTVFHLGDLAMGKFDDSMRWAARLNGKKFLLPGNHDKIFSGESRSRQERFAPIYEAAGFELLPEAGHVIELGGHQVLLHHFPYRGDSHEHDRYVELRPADTGLPLLHGHIHETRHILGRQFNVGVDVNGFAPVHQDTIISFLERLQR